jgi:hypothetical protein
MWTPYHFSDYPNVLFRGNEQLAVWDHIGQTGVVGHPILIGNILYVASDMGNSGIAAYDISPSLQSPGTPPRLLGVLKAAIGGYWPEPWGGDGRLLIMFPARENGRFFVADVTDPADMRVIADRNLNAGGDPSYVQFQDGFAFMDRYKINMRNDFSVALTLDANGHGVDVSQFSLPIGNLVATGGYSHLPTNAQGLALWAHQSAPDTTGPSVGYHIPRADQINYPVGAPITLLIHETLRSETIINGSTFLVRPIGANGSPGAPIAGRLVFTFDDLLSFTPSQPLSANTTYEVLLPAGGIQDAVGNGMVPYSFRFSTGSGLGAGNQAPVVASFDITPQIATVGQSVSLQFGASDPEGGSVLYKVDFGDGGPDSGWTSATSISHVYSSRGHFEAVLSARDSSGATVSLRRKVNVLEAVPSTRPASSSSIVHDSSRSLTWVVNPDSGSLSRIDSSESVLEIPLGESSRPRNVAVDAGGNAWVTCQGSDEVVVVPPSGDTASLQRLVLPYGSEPFGIVAVPGSTSMLVTLYGRGELRRFSTATRSQSGVLPLGATARAISVSANGQNALVTRFISPDNGGVVWSVSLASNLSLTRTIALSLDMTSDDTNSSGRGLPNYLSSIAITPDGQRAWVASKLDNIERGLFVRGTDLNQENTVRAVISQIDLASGLEVAGARRDIDNADSPSAIAFTPAGDYAFVSLQGNNTVGIYDLYRPVSGGQIVPFVARLGTGSAPQGIAYDDQARRIIVNDYLSRRVTIFDLTGFYSGESLAAARAVGTVSVEPLYPEVILGKQIFYNASDGAGPFGRNRMSGEGYISCASCHIDGGHDGRTWDFTGRGEGLRNTTDLRGRRGMGHGFVHWSANFDEIQDFENDIRNNFGGAGFMSDAEFVQSSETFGAPKAGRSPELDALAEYVSSLDARQLPRSPYRNADGSKTAAALRGEAVFNAQSCGSCHGGASFTDSNSNALNLHNVGTLSSSSGARLGLALNGVDTPTLLSLAATGPYFHDGAASDLSGVFSIAGATVLQAEDATMIGSAGSFTNQYGGSFHEGRAVGFSNGSDLVRFQNVDGGTGGPARLTIRYSALYGNRAGVVTVNGSPTQVTFLRTSNTPNWYPSAFATHSLNVTLNAGSTNTIDLQAVAPNQTQLYFDEIAVSNSQMAQAASVHRRVLDLSAGERQDLERYLLELDGSDDRAGDAPRPSPRPTAPPTSPPNPDPNGPADGPADACPDDAAKVDPGVCGCGVFDTDMDGNGVVDCLQRAAKPRLAKGKKGKLKVSLASGADFYEIRFERQKPRRTLSRRSAVSVFNLKVPAGVWRISYRSCFSNGVTPVCIGWSETVRKKVR